MVGINQDHVTFGLLEEGDVSDAGPLRESEAAEYRQLFEEA